MDCKSFDSIVRMVIFALPELYTKVQLLTMFNDGVNKYTIVFTKSDLAIIDYVVFDASVEKPVLFGDGYIDCGTARIGDVDGLAFDLLTMFAKI